MDARRWTALWPVVLTEDGHRMSQKQDEDKDGFLLGLCIIFNFLVYSL